MFPQTIEVQHCNYCMCNCRFVEAVITAVLCGVDSFAARNLAKVFFLLLQVSSTSQSCTELSGNSAFKFYETSVTELHVEQRTPSPAIQLSVAAAAAGNGRLEPSYLKCHEFMVDRCLNSPQEAAEMLMAMPLGLLRTETMLEQCS